LTPYGKKRGVFLPLRRTDGTKKKKKKNTKKKKYPQKTCATKGGSPPPLGRRPDGDGKNVLRGRSGPKGEGGKEEASEGSGLPISGSAQGGRGKFKKGRKLEWGGEGGCLRKREPYLNETSLLKGKNETAREAKSEERKIKPQQGSYLTSKETVALKKKGGGDALIWRERGKLYSTEAFSAQEWRKPLREGGRGTKFSGEGRPVLLRGEVSLGKFDRKGRKIKHGPLCSRCLFRGGGVNGVKGEESFFLLLPSWGEWWGNSVPWRSHLRILQESDTLRALNVSSAGEEKVLREESGI